jgi:hypothetical protein
VLLSKCKTSTLEVLAPWHQYLPTLKSASTSLFLHLLPLLKVLLMEEYLKNHLQWHLLVMMMMMMAVLARRVVALLARRVPMEMMTTTMMALVPWTLAPLARVARKEVMEMIMMMTLDPLGRRAPLAREARVEAVLMILDL